MDNCAALASLHKSLLRRDNFDGLSLNKRIGTGEHNRLIGV